MRFVLSLVWIPLISGCASWCNLYTCAKAECADCGPPMCGVTERCLEWCNTHTCDDDHCKACSKCQALEDETHCADWCTEYNCDNPQCEGCAKCTTVDHETICANWCNEWTCGSFECSGCEVEHCKQNDGCPCVGNGGAAAGTTYGAATADKWANYCSAWDGEMDYCKAGGSSFGSDWCADSFCYVDPNNCDGARSQTAQPETSPS